jgi:hypothetical protein
MPHLLHLDSSADLVDSRSRAITAAFAKAQTLLEDAVARAAAPGAGLGV